MNRLYILLTVMVGALFTGQEALAKVLTGTAGDDTLVGTNGDDHIEGRAGTTQSKVAAATTQSPPAKATIT
jgi:hypothetical protein